ncbi:hypothetical protein ACFYT3_22555 [Nocardia amikacinitolerans]|uniref:hypothetical protein n=1 Tax=Nocardia amikacinitolerans TaxID=756689 RepID=UPI003683C774
MLVTPHSADPDPDPDPGVGFVVPGVVGVGEAGVGLLVEGGVTHRLGGVVVVCGVVVGAGVAGVGATGTVGVGGWAEAPAAPVTAIRTAASTAAAAAAAVRAVGEYWTGTGAGGACAEVFTVRLR